MSRRPSFPLPDGSIPAVQSPASSRSLPGLGERNLSWLSTAFATQLLVVLLLAMLGCGTKDAPEPDYIQDRRVRTFDIRPPSKARLDSIQKGQYNRDSSGWYLVWTRPLNTEGWVRVYLFADSLRGDVAGERLRNGRDPINVAGMSVLAIRDTTAGEEDSIQIPSWVFGNLQGDSIPADTTYYFTIWVQYADGEIAPPSIRPFSRGDIYPPAIAGPIAESIGSTRATLSWKRPADQVGEFDTEFNGSFRSIHVAVWADTAGTCRTPEPANLPRQDSVLRSWCRESANSSADSFRARHQVDFARCDTSLPSINLSTQRIVLDDLLPMRSYRYVVTLVDSAGLSSQSLIGCLKTRDPHPPTPPGALAIEPGTTSSRIELRFQAASDSFVDTAAVHIANHDIQRYIIEVNGRRFDSLALARRPAPGFVDTTEDRTRRPWGVWRWDGTSWSWSHTLFEPSTAYAFHVWAVDSSGNDVRSRTPVEATTSARVAGAICPPGWIPVTGGTDITHGTSDTGAIKRDSSLRAIRIALSDYCIEKFEHGGSRSLTGVTWSQAIEICGKFTDTLRQRNLLQRGDSVELCSESQWERACRGTTDANYGAIGLPMGSTADTLSALRAPCALGNDDPRVDTSSPPRDPVCRSEWGVRDLVGRVAEWTRDVYHTRGNQVLPGQTDPAYTGASNLTGDATLGTLRGGSFLVLQDTSLTLPSARCWERTYPAFNVIDTTTRVRRPNPAMTSPGIGFRCCLRRGS